MGAVFAIDHANFVSYLTADFDAAPPRADGQTLKTFLMSLADGRGLISSTQGTPEDWVEQIRYAADRESKTLSWDSQILDPSEVGQRLDPLRTHFTGYYLYAMVIPSGSYDVDIASFRFFREAAVSSHANALILMPEGNNYSLTSVVDPFPPMKVLAENPTKPPLVVFWTILGTACVFPLKEALEFYRKELLSALDEGVRRVDRVVASGAARSRAKRILHLSDLHFGTPEAARRRRWLKEQLSEKLTNINRVVVTGDLFDNPKEVLRESFDEFRTDVENITNAELLVIPGNHDVRNNGNAFGIFGKNSEFVTDLRWHPIFVDHELRTIFISFNSSETGNFATGAVGERQRLDRSSLLHREVRRNQSVSDYLKVALVHHHPYSYGSEPKALYEKILARIFGDEERFIAFEGAEEFMQWCAAQGVSLVLHGHKHVPHWVRATIRIGNKEQSVAVIGCGSTTGAGGRPMCYDVVALDPETKRWNALFYHDERGDGSGFRIQNVTLDLRTS